MQKRDGEVHCIICHQTQQFKKPTKRGTFLSQRIMLVKLDVLHFDIQTDFAYLINQVKGRVKSKQLVADSKKSQTLNTWKQINNPINKDGE